MDRISLAGVFAIIGYTAGMVSGMVIVSGFDSRLVQISKAMSECESTLPRNQTCKYVITAVAEVAE